MTQGYIALLERIEAFARSDEGIRFLGLVGSSSNGENLDDEYSDIDLVIVTDSIARYFGDDAWLRSIDEVWMTFTESAPEINYLERRCVFAGGRDADFVLVDAAKFLSQSDSFPVLGDICRKTLRPLIDRDGLMGRFLDIAKDAHLAPPPTQATFDNLINDFYFHYLWAFKKLMRGEYWVALQCINGYMKARTLTALEWYERSTRGPEYKTYYQGRYLERWLESPLREGLSGIFSRYDRQEMIGALTASNDFFTKVAMATARNNGLAFPEERARRLSDWIRINYASGDVR